MAFKPSKAKKNLEKEEGSLNMNSMMDMMTIILLFLLKSFSTEGALITPSENLRLPNSTADEKAKKELMVSVTKKEILVNDQPLVPINASTVPKDQMLIPALAAKLAEYAQQERELEIEVGKEFTHQVVIQGDYQLPFELIMKVMFTCAKSEFYKIRLLTIKVG